MVLISNDGPLCCITLQYAHDPRRAILIFSFNASDIQERERRGQREPKTQNILISTQFSKKKKNNLAISLQTPNLPQSLPHPHMNNHNPESISSTTSCPEYAAQPLHVSATLIGRFFSLIASVCSITLIYNPALTCHAIWQWNGHTPGLSV